MYLLKNEESLSMDYMRTKDNDHFNAMTSPKQQTLLHSSY